MTGCEVSNTIKDEEGIDLCSHYRELDSYKNITSLTCMQWTGRPETLNSKCCAVKRNALSYAVPVEKYNIFKILETFQKSYMGFS
jgi:hypothetical protein